jgi:four helix bundle protein
MQTSKKKDNLLIKLSFELAISVVEFCAVLEEKRKWSLADQVLRAGLSVGANSREAQNAESRADFIHKLKIAAKEADELEFYLEVCTASKYLPTPEGLLTQVDIIGKVLNRIITSSRLNKKSAN